MFSTNRKYVLYIVSVIAIAVSVWYYFSENERAEIPTLFPSQQSYKTKPQTQTGFIHQDKDKTIYDNFSMGLKSSRVIKLLPEPEAPLLLKQNNDFDNDVFSALGSQNADSNNDILTKEEGHDSIWDNIDESMGSASKALPKKKLDSDAKSLQITNISEIKSSPTANKIQKKQHYYIQLAYTRSSRDCEKQWEKIKSSNKKILSKHRHTIANHRKDDLVFYQLLAGPFDEFKEAKHICTRIKLEKHKCLVVKQ